LPVPWWRSGWAIAGYAIGLGLLAVAVIRARTRALRVRTATLEGAVARRTLELAEEQQRIERQSVDLTALIEAKDRLLARISHEFRTPLAVILGPTRRLAAEQGTTRAAVQALGTIERGASRLLRLVEQLLSVARLSHGYRGATVAVPAAAVARRMAGAYESRAAERGLVLTTGGLEDVLVQSSVEVLEAIIGQLLLHAIRLADGAGTVRVSVMHGDHLGQIIVEADGPGFAAGRLAEAFESQRSIDFSSDATGDEAGDVELPFVAQLVASHGGTIEIVSTSATGSRFVIRLSKAFAGAAVMEPGAHGAAAVTPATDRQDEARTATILVIEDHPDMREYLRQLLQTRYRCVTAPDGERGLAMAREDVPDLVVCDVMLPGQDGFAVCHGLKTDERTSHIPVVLLTALEGEQHRLRGLEEGADDYLAKPFEDAELLGRVAGLIELRALLRQRYARDLRIDLKDAADVGVRDRAFLARLKREVEHRHADAGLEVGQLAGRLAMSERQLQRKVRALLGVTPAEYLRSVRLQHAQERLLAGERPSDVALAVGFSSHAYFATCFKAEYGYPPGETRRRTEPLAPESPATT
jgi:signal transduction histidine kinase/DNA-binding response OmpR family regulator